MTDDLKRMESEGGIVEPDAPQRGESERKVLHRTMIALSTAGARVFRNHVGTAYQGKALRFTQPTVVNVEQGDIVIRKARTVRAGLMTGSSDLVGWNSRLIDEYDVGRRVAQFIACEVKSIDGEVEPEQQQFLEVVRDSGGVAILARSADEAVQKLTEGGGI